MKYGSGIIKSDIGGTMNLYKVKGRPHTSA
jgi:hypothetical protein